MSSLGRLRIRGRKRDITRIPNPDFWKLDPLSDSEFDQRLSKIETDPYFLKLINEEVIRFSTVKKRRIPIDKIEDWYIMQAQSLIEKYQLDSNKIQHIYRMGKCNFYEIQELARAYEIPPSKMALITKGLLFEKRKPLREVNIAEFPGGDLESETIPWQEGLPRCVASQWHPLYKREKAVPEEKFNLEIFLAGLYDRLKIEGIRYITKSKEEFISEMSDMRQPTYQLLRKYQQCGLDFSQVQKILQNIYTIVADVRLDDSEKMLVDIIERGRSSPLTSTFSLDRQKLRSLTKGSLWRQHRKEFRAILKQLPEFRIRIDSLHRIVHYLCKFQVNYLRTGKPIDLRPVTLRMIAANIGWHPTTVGRWLGLYGGNSPEKWDKPKAIITPHGILKLLDLCPNRAKLVSELVEEYPDLNDEELSEKYRERFGIKRTGRIICYGRRTNAIPPLGKRKGES